MVSKLSGLERSSGWVLECSDLSCFNLLELVWNCFAKDSMSVDTYKEVWNINGSKAIFARCWLFYIEEISY